MKSREKVFRPTIGSESSHEISNKNGVRVVNFATSKNLIVTISMLPYRNIYKYISCLDWKTHSQTDNLLIIRRRNSNIVDILSFRGTDS